MIAYLYGGLAERIRFWVCTQFVSKDLSQKI